MDKPLVLPFKGARKRGSGRVHDSASAKQPTRNFGSEFSQERFRCVKINRAELSDVGNIQQWIMEHCWIEVVAK